MKCSFNSLLKRLETFEVMLLHAGLEQELMPTLSYSNMKYRDTVIRTPPLILEFFRSVNIVAYVDWY
jgi:hypothetical protein